MRTAGVIGCVAAGLLVGGAVVAAARSKRPEPEVAEVPSAPEGARRSGLALVGGLVVVEDANAFLEYVAASLGAELPADATAEDVLVRLLGDRFPDHVWPPEHGELLRQWDFMVTRISAIMQRNAPPPPSRLHVVS